MTTTLKAMSRQAAAACLFTAIVAGLLAPGFAGAHEISAEEVEIAKSNPGTRQPPGGRNARPGPPTNLRMVATHNAVVVSWDAGHGHAGQWWRNNRFIGHRLFLAPSGSGVNSDDVFANCPDDFSGCTWRLVPLGNTGFRAGSSDHFEGAHYSETISGLMPSTGYWGGVSAVYQSRSGQEVLWGTYAIPVTTTAAPEPETPAPPEPETPAPPEPETPTPPEPETPTPPEPETPTPPEPETPTPPEPETPTPPEPECRWEHRFSTFPAADGSGRGVLRITARKKGAQVRITAFDRTDGTALTVRDLGNGRELSSPAVTLGAANTVARFAVAGDAGQHVLVVSHAEHVAGIRAVTATMMRQSGGTSQVVHPDVAEHCAPSAPTAPEPETPAPPEPECRWEHRFGTFPTADSSGRGVLRITARKKDAQVRIAAFDRTHGTALTVRDLGNDRELSSPTVTLGAANTVARFAVDGDAGRHVLVVSHAEHVAGMRAVTATMVRQSGGGASQVVHPDVAEHCEPSAAPDLVIRNAGALLWPDTFDWRASVVNIGDAAAAPTTVRVYHGARELDTKAIERGVAAGSEWPMSDFITRNRPPVGDQVRICVDPVPGEAAPNRTNNCASATVERNN